jgi:hypothetical protein
MDNKDSTCSNVTSLRLGIDIMIIASGSDSISI